MKRAATIAASLALVMGLPQMWFSYVALFASGWMMPLFLALLLLPVAPLFLIFFPRRALPPAMPATAAIMSIAVSSGLIWVFYHTD